MTRTTEVFETVKHLMRQFMRFGVIGVLNTALFYTLYLVFLAFIKPTISYLFAYVLSMIFAILMNLKFTFEKRATLRKISSFVAVYLMSMFIGGLVLNVFIGFSIDARVAGLLTIGVTVITNFVGLKAAAKWA